jgi:hypothetical protein
MIMPPNALRIKTSLKIGERSPEMGLLGTAGK